MLNEIENEFNDNDKKFVILNIEFLNLNYVKGSDAFSVGT